MANARHRLNRSIPDLELGDDHRSTLKCTTRIRYHCRIHRIICGLCDRNQIFASRPIDKNKGHPARGIPNALKIIEVDSFFQKPVSCCRTERIRSVGSKKSDMPSRPRCGYRLVGTLAATEHLELPSKDCFS